MFANLVSYRLGRYGYPYIVAGFIVVLKRNAGGSRTSDYLEDSMAMYIKN